MKYLLDSFHNLFHLGKTIQLLIKRFETWRWNSYSFIGIQSAFAMITISTTSHFPFLSHSWFVCFFLITLSFVHTYRFIHFNLLIFVIVSRQLMLIFVIERLKDNEMKKKWKIGKATKLLKSFKAGGKFYFWSSANLVPIVCVSFRCVYLFVYTYIHICMYASVCLYRLHSNPKKSSRKAVDNCGIAIAIGTQLKPRDGENWDGKLVFLYRTPPWLPLSIHIYMYIYIFIYPCKCSSMNRSFH